MIVLIFLSLSLSTLANPFHNATAPTENMDYRLPTTIIPSKYKVHLIIPKEALQEKSNNFYGNVHIDLKVLKPTNKIFIHSLVDIKDITLSDQNNFNNTVLNFALNDTTEIMMIKFKYNLVISINYTLGIKYQGNLTTNGFKGISRIKFKNDTKTETLLVTQFQAENARYAFPCFDEPAFKAVFVLIMNYPKEYTALTNTPKMMETLDEIDKDTKITIFKETPKMSTYLLAFSLSKFTCTKSIDALQKIPFQVCSRDLFSNDRALALEYGKKVVNVMSQWTNYNYSSTMKKMDQFVVPSLFEVAMENWGFVTYSEFLNLWNKNYTSNLYKQTIIELIAHEISHQWFGNLVTTNWWSNLFLNEGLATYFQHYLFSQIGLDNYEMDKQFVINQQQTAFPEDASTESSAISSPVSSREEINEKFGTISYNKAGSIFRMIANVMGQNSFQDGLRLYLKQNAFGISTPEKLWNSLSSSIKSGILPDGVTFTKFVDNWINKPGFPVINVTSSGNDVILTQKQFLYDGENSTQWYVPIYYKTLNGATNLVWLKPNSTRVLKNVIANEGWIILNHNCWGYYRVNYDPVLLNRITIALRKNINQVTDIDRSQIVDDAFNLALANQISYLKTFQIIEYLENETSYYPWTSALRGFKDLTRLFDEDSNIVRNINKLLLKFMNNVIANISLTNWDNIDHISSLKLPTLWKAACKAGQKTCIMETKRLFSEFRDKNVNVNPNIRSAVYCNALRYSTDIDSDWSFLWNRLKVTEQVHEKIFILDGLGCTKSKKHLKFYLDQSIASNSTFTPLDFDAIWNTIFSSSTVGLESALDYFLNHSVEILKYYPDGADILVAMTNEISTEDQVKQLEKISKFDKNSYVRSIASICLVSARDRIKLKSKMLKNGLEELFDKNPSVIKH